MMQRRRSVLIGGICFLLGAMMAAFAATAIRPEQFVALPWSWTATQTFDGTHTITGLPSPSSSSDVATRGYVLSGAGGGGTVTSITCNGGLTGGAITTSGTCALDLTHANDWSGIQSFQDGKLKLDGSSSGTTILSAAATASGTISLPAVTDTVAVLGTAQTFTAAQTFAEAHGGLPEVVTLTSNDYVAVAADCGKIKTLPTGTTPTVHLPNLNVGCTITFVTTAAISYRFLAASGGSTINSQSFTQSRGTAAGDTVSATIVVNSGSAAKWNISGDLTS